MRLLLSCLVLLATACSGRGPDAPQRSSAAAMADKVPRQMQVIKVWHLVNDNVRPADDNLSISHMVEVKMLSGDHTGSVETLPYDEWMVGEAPPAAGATVTAAPRDWVARNPKSTGRPFGGW